MNSQNQEHQQQHPQVQEGTTTEDTLHDKVKEELKLLNQQQQQQHQQTNLSGGHFGFTLIFASKQLEFNNSTKTMQRTLIIICIALCAGVLKWRGLM